MSVSHKMSKQKQEKMDDKRCGKGDAQSAYKHWTDAFAGVDTRCGRAGRKLCPAAQSVTCAGCRICSADPGRALPKGGRSDRWIADSAESAESAEKSARRETGPRPAPERDEMNYRRRGAGRVRPAAGKAGKRRAKCVRICSKSARTSAEQNARNRAKNC